MSVQADYQRQYRASHPEFYINNRWLVRTHHRALQRLAAEFPARFAELLDEERQAEPDPRLVTNEEES